MDPKNLVVKLCAEGMELEGRDPAMAKRRFDEAWGLASDDYEACIAAHYVARHQGTPEETLRWNQIALDRARAAAVPQIAGFMPSLHLNLGKALEDCGQLAPARLQYELARASVKHLPEDGYRQFVEGGIERALERVGADHSCS
jgi:hypothetical protein